MKKPDHLFALIKSLNKSEKRYFRLYSRRLGGKEASNYERVFEALDRQQAYDEGALRQQFAGEAFARQFSVVKHYLYNQILKSLRAYRERKKPLDMQVAEALEFLPILYEKGLNEQCCEIITKARRLLEKFENHTARAELLRWELKLRFDMQGGALTDTEARELTDARLEALRKAANLAEYERLSYRLETLMAQVGLVRSAEHKQRYEDLLREDLVADSGRALSVEARYHYLFINKKIAVSLRDSPRFFEYGTLLARHFEEYPNYLRLRPAQYISALYSLLLSAMERGEDNAFDAALQKVEGFAREYGVRLSLRLEAETFYVYYYFTIQMALQRAAFERGAQIIAAVESGVQRFGRVLPQDDCALFTYSCAYLHFGAGRYRAALRSLDPFFQPDSPIAGYCGPYLSFVKLLHVALYFELGDTNYVSYAVKSTYRFLHKKKLLFELEKHALQTLRELLALSSPDGLQACLAQARQRILPLLDNEYEAAALLYFDALAYIDCKLTGKSFAEAAARRKKG